ncbi:MAG: copper homeostasis protein CutC, partial [Spirochaetota bacterium]
GAAGIVFGILNEDGTVDQKRNAILAEIGLAAGLEVVFHRAIDVVPSWENALTQLIDMGFTRVLTTGQRANIEDGVHIVQAMVAYANHRIEILPGGLKPQNIVSLSARMNTNQAHIASFQQLSDNSCQNNREIFFGGALYPPEMLYDMIDQDFVAQACQMVKT